MNKQAPPSAHHNNIITDYSYLCHGIYNLFVTCKIGAASALTVIELLLHPLRVHAVSFGGVINKYVGNNADQLAILYQRATAHPLYDAAGCGQQRRVRDLYNHALRRGACLRGLILMILQLYGLMPSLLSVVKSSASPSCTSSGKAMGTPSGKSGL